MTITLYLPGHTARVVTLSQRPVMLNGFAQAQEQVATFLNCLPSLVDVLATGDDYVVYSVFDSEETVNLQAMETLSRLSGIDFSLADEDSVLRGPVLVVEEL